MVNQKEQHWIHDDAWPLEDTIPKNARYTATRIQLQTRTHLLLVPHSIPRNLLDVSVPTDIKKDIEFGEEALHDVPHAFFTHDAQTVDPHSSDHDHLGSQRQSLESIGARSYS